jgi:hypothetical protein
MRGMLVASAMFIGAGLAKSPASGAPMTIRLVNAETVPAQVLRQAQAAAASMLSRAGLQVEWVDCARQPCASISGLWIQFVDQRPPGLHGETAGYAVVYPAAAGTDGYAVVAWHPVQAAAAELDLDPGPLLGAAMVHEIGHLLLGRNAHARSGVMVPRFRRREMEMAARGELGFTGEQVKQIRAAWAR